MARTTTNDKFRPSKGSRLDLSVERVGVPGDESQFTKIQGDYTLFLNVHESFLGYKTILKVHNQIAVIPEGQSETPVYERYTLGGRSFRGFGTQGVSPVGLRRDGSVSGDPVGGSFLFFLGGEIQQPVYQDIVSLVGFVDTGTVDTSVSLARYRVSVGAGVRIGVPALSPVPLAFDFGFPLIKQSTDRERLFTFSIDIPF
jgi:outer membrane protein insertion porin family